MAFVEKNKNILQHKNDLSSTYQTIIVIVAVFKLTFTLRDAKKIQWVAKKKCWKIKVNFNKHTKALLSIQQQIADIDLLQVACALEIFFKEKKVNSRAPHELIALIMDLISWDVPQKRERVCGKKTRECYCLWKFQIEREKKNGVCKLLRCVIAYTEN